MLAKSAWAFFVSYHLLFGLAFAILLGIAAPSPGKAVGRWPFDVPNTCVSLIFLLAGLKLKTEELRNAVKFPKALIVGVILILFITPLFGFIFLALDGAMEYPEFVTGLTMFAVLPTTISSGVVITGLAKGNVGLSLVLSVSTNILGVLTVPFMLAFVLGADGSEMKPWELLGKLCLTILVPVVIGKALSFIGIVAALSKRFDVTIKLLSSFFLVVIPWIKISQADKYIANVSVGSIFALLFLGLAMHVMFLLFNYAVAVAVKLDTPDLKATVITASQKTLGTGVAIVAFLPSSFGIPGLIILPFIFAHFGQIAMDGFMVPWWLRREGTPSSMWMLASWRSVTVSPTPNNRDGSSGDDGGGGTASTVDENAKGDSVVMLDDVESRVIDDSSIVVEENPKSTVQPVSGVQERRADTTDRHEEAISVSSMRIARQASEDGSVDATPRRANNSFVSTPLRAPKRTPLMNIMTNARTPPVRFRKHRNAVVPVSFIDENVPDTPVSVRSAYSSEGDWV